MVACRAILESAGAAAMRIARSALPSESQNVPETTTHTTIVRAGARPPGSGGLSTGLPLDLVEQVRGRVQLLAALLLVAFAIDPVLYFMRQLVAAVVGETLPPEFFLTAPFQWVSTGAVVASAALWWAAHNRRVSPDVLHWIGLAYQVAVCFTIGLTSNWQEFITHGTLPNLTHVTTVVILFPLIMPGPPRRMLVAAIVSASMSPLSVLVLQLTGQVTATSESYVQAIVSPAFGVVFAYMGARVVYGLGREVAAAREMGSYQLEERLGQGGMGEVWRARHRMLARPAAIKLIRPGLLGDVRPGVADEIRRRFEREAQAIAGLRSPHTVDLYDFGVADNGAFYCVMELLDGMDTDTLVRRFGPLPAERVIYVLRQVCHSLSEADARGLVHRDIKPANVFLCRYGEEHDFVKVLDFGLVKALGEPTEAVDALTRETVVHGTPAFIAPEQALGNARIDGRADLYATGCVAYWLLTGQLVFQADTPMGLVMEHVRTVPVPPSSRTELPIPAALDRLVLDCLAKRPEDRPDSARELLRRLDEIEIPRPWTKARAAEWWEAHLPAAAPVETWTVPGSDRAMQPGTYSDTA
jgi:eukaryotic-like serine/threonine-protein kinase